MDENKMDLHPFTLFYLRKEKQTMYKQQKRYVSFMEIEIAEWIVCECFTEFRSGRLDLEDLELSSSISVIDEFQI